MASSDQHGQNHGNGTGIQTIEWKNKRQCLKWQFTKHIIDDFLCMLGRNNESPYELGIVETAIKFEISQNLLVDVPFNFNRFVGIDMPEGHHMNPLASKENTNTEHRFVRRQRVFL